MVKRIAILCFLAVGSPAKAIEVVVTVTNLSGPEGLALSPFFIGAHDGSFDAFDSGIAAGPGIEAIAELGSGAELAAELSAAHAAAATATVAATAGGFGPGIFLPAGTGSITLDLDPVMHRYLTYGAMVVPSNDYFVGNDSPTGIELFDAMGNFMATDVLVRADQIWDAGTEVDNPSDGPAFVVGQDATSGVAEGGVISLAEGFAAFSGVSTPAGYVFSQLPTGSDEIARISIALPEPSSVGLAFLGMLGAGVVVRRQRRHGTDR